jgi:hypothetical protein
MARELPLNSAHETPPPRNGCFFLLILSSPLIISLGMVYFDSNVMSLSKLGHDISAFLNPHQVAIEDRHLEAVRLSNVAQVKLANSSAATKVAQRPSTLQLKGILSTPTP